MKTTYLITASLAFALAFATSSLAGSHASSLPVLLGTLAVGDTPPQSVDDLLRKARSAMEAGNFETADSLITRAEEQKQSFSPFHTGDTPKKARADLDKKRATKPGPQRPAGLGSTPGSRPAAKPQDGSSADKNPFAARPVSPPSPTALGTSALPAVAAAPAITTPDVQYPNTGAPAALPAANALSPNTVPANIPLPLSTGSPAGSSTPPATPSPIWSNSPPAADPSARISSAGAATPWSNAQETPSGRAVTAQPPTDNQINFRAAELTLAKDAGQSGNTRQRSDELLLSARRALAQGDSRRATALLEQAKTLNVDYGQQDNEPVKVENLVRKHSDLMTSKAGREQTDSYRRQFSDLLLEEAVGLIKCGDLDEAERLASDAQKMGVRYSPFETRPTTVLDKVLAARGPGRSPAPATPLTLQPAGASTTTTPLPGTPPVGPQGIVAARREVQDALREARAALAAGKLGDAEECLAQAEAWKLSEAQFSQGDDRPGLVRLEIQKTKQRSIANGGSAPRVTQSGYAEPGENRASFGTQAVYDPSNDPTQVRLVAEGQPAAPREPAALPEPPAPPGKAAPGPAMRFFQQGEEALKANDTAMAVKYFEQAQARRTDLDPIIQSRLQDHLQMLASPRAKKGSADKDSLLPITASTQQVMAKQVSAAVTKNTLEADKLLEREPKKAVELIKKLRGEVEMCELDQAEKTALLRRVDLTLNRYAQHIEAHRADIELNEKNKEILTEIDSNRKVKNQVQDRLHKLVDEFNKAVHEHNNIEAERIAKVCRELAPDDPVVMQLTITSKLLAATRRNDDIRGRKEDAVLREFQDNDEASIPFAGPITYPDVKKWEQLTKRREAYGKDKRFSRSPKDIEIEQRLSTPLSCSFRDKPLLDVLQYIGRSAQVNVHLDPQGLMAEGCASDTLVTLDLQNEITARSALKILLTPLHLSYVVGDEVLKITSERLRDNNVYTQTYNVADLVIPIPNFVPNGNMGLNGYLREGYSRAGVNDRMAGFMGSFGGPVSVVASNDHKDGLTPKNVLANQQNVMGQVRPGATGALAGGPGAGVGGPNTFGKGPGGLGGGTQADFDPLIELITTTVKPTSWEAAGGPGNVKGFEGTLSLVVSNTQEVHEEIAELLKQLRRLQDLQVTIEVRFITLSDAFFERIGVDFDFNINDNSGLNPAGPIPPAPNDKVVPGRVVGVDPTSIQLATSNDLDIQFRQGGFTEAIPPPFPGVAFNPATAATFGFAILSDIEAYFLVHAAQGDNRSNILQAPKVTLFNGQQAFVSDTTQRPFVASVIPVVGDFAAAQQPVIVVLSEGTQLTVQAVVTADRRFVRLTVVPFFSQIGDVQEFTFTGSATTKSSSSASSQDDTSAKKSTSGTDDTITREGTTVQLPTFSFVTVTTTVSVPDGGTVLLGGIKRLSEGRNERGVPMLDKIPYLNRLFKNVGIARTTTSLMMMVTPHIIIQEEEEEKLLGQAPGG